MEYGSAEGSSILLLLSPVGIAHFTAAMFFAGSGLYAAARHFPSEHYRLYAVTAALLALMQFAEFTLSFSSGHNWAILAGHVKIAFTYLLPATLFFLIRRLSLQPMSVRPGVFLTISAIGFAGGHVFFNAGLFVMVRSGQGWAPSYLGPAYLLNIYFFVALLSILTILSQALYAAQDLIRDRWQYSMLAVGFFSFDALSWYIAPAYTIIPMLFGSLLLYYLASNRYLWTLRELSKKTVFWFLASSIPIIPISVLNYILISNPTRVSGVFLLTVVLLSFYFLFFYFRQYQHQIDRYFQRIPHDLEKRLNDFKSNLLYMLSIKDLIGRLRTMHREVFPGAHGEVLYWNEKMGAFVPYGSKDPPERLRFRVHNDLFLWLGEQERIFQKNEFAVNPELAEVKDAAIDFFARTGSQILVPFTLNRSLLAVTYLGAKLDGSAFSKGEHYFLGEIRNVGSIAISNSVLHDRLTILNETLEEKVKQRTRDLEEAQSHLVHSEKLASLGVMVAGIAHEINTPTGVINAAVQNIGQNLTQFLRSALERSGGDLEKTLFEVLAQSRRTNLDASGRYKRTRELTAKLVKEHDLSADESEKRADYIVTFSADDLEKDIAILSDEEFAMIVGLTRLSHNIQNIRIAIEAIVRIVKALKYYSHVDQSKTEQVQVREGLDNTLVIMHNQLKHGIEVHLQVDDLPAIECFAGELNQVWTNLISNAIDSMDGTGELTISLKQVYLKRKPGGLVIEDPELLRLVSEKPARYAYQCVTFQDTGKGLSQEARQRMFDPFFTTKGPGHGTGLGLGIVRNIVEKHKGLISFSSKPGDTRFAVYLPVF